ncbi:TPA: cyclic nucleotide-binding domain-containing protein [Streptococcus agalactiae]
MDIENYCQDYCLETIFPKHYFKDLQVITLTAGQSVCKQGEQLEYLHYIVKGRFKIVRRLFNGKEHILDIKTKPTLIGDIELLTNRQIVSSVIALEDITVIQLSLKGRKEKLLTDATFLLKLSQELAQAFHDQNIKASTNLGYTVKELLASRSLADSFGISYRHLLRVIHDMVKEGLIQKEKPKYFIKNRFALESLNIQP